MTKFINESSSDADADAFWRKAKDFEKKLKNIKSNYGGTRKMIPLKKLGEHPYNLPEIVKLLQEEPFQCQEETLVTLQDDMYFQRLKKLWEESDLVEIRNYLVVELMYQIHQFLEQTESEPLESCFEEVKSDDIFKPAMAALYIHENLNILKREIHETAEIEEKIRGEVTLQITNIDWMDDETKEEANEKMRRMATYIGFLNKELTNPSFVDEIYDKLQIAGQGFLQNWQGFIHFRLKAEKNGT